MSPSDLTNIRLVVAEPTGVNAPFCPPNKILELFSGLVACRFITPVFEDENNLVGRFEVIPAIPW